MFFFCFLFKALNLFLPDRVTIMEIVLLLMGHFP